MSSQLRKTMEYLIFLAAKTKSSTIPESVNGQLKFLIGDSTISRNEKDLIYALYGMSSDTGAHPGIGSLDESLLRYRITIETARYLVKLI